jgi:hypothetical protein
MAAFYIRRCGNTNFPVHADQRLEALLERALHYPVDVSTDIPSWDWGLTWYVGDGTDPRAAVHGRLGFPRSRADVNTL